MTDPKKTAAKQAKYRSRDKDKNFRFVIASVITAAVVLGVVLYVLIGERYKPATSPTAELTKQSTPAPGLSSDRPRRLTGVLWCQVEPVEHDPNCDRHEHRPIRAVLFE